MDDYYAEESDYDDSFGISDFVEDWNFRHSLEHAPVGGPVWQPVGDPIVIPSYTLDDQGVWQPPDDPSPSPPAGHNTLVEEHIAAEIMGLPGHLAACLRRHQAGVASRQAYRLDDSFFSDQDIWSEESTERATLPEEEGGNAAPVKSLRRVLLVLITCQQLKSTVCNTLITQFDNSNVYCTICNQSNV